MKQEKAAKSYHKAVQPEDNISILEDDHVDSCRPGDSMSGTNWSGTVQESRYGGPGYCVGVRPCLGIQG